MKRILIYGDSNTYGYDAATMGRFDENTRWTGVCQKLLGDGYRIINRGRNGRTTCHNTVEGSFFNGMAVIKKTIASRPPLDMICIKLGSNDQDIALRSTPELIAENAAAVLKRAREIEEEKRTEADVSCRYVLMAPLEITPDVYNGSFASYYDEKSLDFSRAVTKAFARQAEKDGFLYFDANQFARCGKVDGIHLDKENHRKLGEAFARWVEEISDRRE